MVVPAFGWSAGDIVASIQIIVKISKAFKDAGGASSQFAETTAFLDAFEATLQRIKDYTNDNADAKYTDSIIEQVRLIDGPYSKFEKYMLGFCPALGEASTQSAVHRAPKKVKWALKELSDVSGEVAKLKRAITDPILFIGPLLLLQALETIQSIASATSDLPNRAQLDTLMGYVEEAAVPAQLTQQIHEITCAAQDHGDKLATLRQDLKKSTETLSQELLETRDTAVAMNEKFTQEQISRSTDTLMRIDETRENMARMLDSIITILHRPGHNEDEGLQTFEKALDGQKLALCQVQHSVEASLVQLTETVTDLQMAMKEESDIRQTNVDSQWLGRLCRQLITSGITSAMTGAVVFLATKSGYTAPHTEASRIREMPLPGQTCNLITRSSTDSLKPWDHARGASFDQSTQKNESNISPEIPPETTSTTTIPSEVPQIAGHARDKRSLECPFNFLFCDELFSDIGEWFDHSIKHFGTAGAPHSSQCCFCDKQFGESPSVSSWKQRMMHVAEHHSNGCKLAHARPDFELYTYLWNHRLISDAEYQELEGNDGKRYSQDGDSPTKNSPSKPSPSDYLRPNGIGSGSSCMTGPAPRLPYFSDGTEMWTPKTSRRSRDARASKLSFASDRTKIRALKTLHHSQR